MTFWLIVTSIISFALGFFLACFGLNNFYRTAYQQRLDQRAVQDFERELGKLFGAAVKHNRSSMN